MGTIINLNLRIFYVKFKCECGRIHANELEFIEISRKVDDLARNLKELKLGKKCLIVSGPKTYRIAASKIEEELEKEFKVKTFIAPKFTLENLRNLIKISKRFDFELAVGGGSVIDLAKFSSFRNGKRFVAFPTTLSHDGIASPIVSLRTNSTKLSVLTKQPVAIFVDLSIISKAPRRLRLAGFGDILAKYTSLADWKLGKKEFNEYYCEYTANLVKESLKRVLKAKKDVRDGTEKGLKVEVESLINCGVAMAYVNSSRPCSGSEHLLAHYLDLYSRSNALHGEKCALATIIMSKLHKLKWKKIREVMEFVGLKTTARALRISKESLINGIVKCKNLRIDRYTILHKLNLNEEEAEKIATETHVI